MFTLISSYTVIPILRSFLNKKFEDYNSVLMVVYGRLVEEYDRKELEDMKLKIITLLLIISIGIHLFTFGKSLLLEKPYQPTPEEKVLLSEMVVKTLQSEDYQKIAETQQVIAIDTSVDKNKGGVFPYYMVVSVRTDHQTYHFTCTDEKCQAMENGGWSYSIYKQEQPRLPFK